RAFHSPVSAPWRRTAPPPPLRCPSLLRAVLVWISKSTAKVGQRRIVQFTSVASAHILIVDDEPANVRLLERILDREGYTRLTSILDPRRVLPFIVNAQPDLILLDLWMPHVDGFELLEQIAPLVPPGTFLPILVLTAHIGPEVGQRALKLGATDFLTKPIDPLELLLRIRNALQLRALHVRLRDQNRMLDEQVQERTRSLEQALEDLRRAQQSIIEQERLHALGQMAGGIVHDFNNALAPVLGFSEILLNLLAASKTAIPRARLQQYLELIHTGASDAAEVVKRLREFYRPPGEFEHVSPVDLRGMVNQTVALTQPRWRDQAQARGLSIRIETDLQPVPLFAGDEAGLREALTTLLFNAVDAMPEGGTVTLRTREVEGGVLLEVQDTGSGMTEEVRRRCLEPFFTTKGRQGTGLGLAMVYGVIKRHEGTIAIESRPGQGTRFSIRLPAREVVPTQPRATPRSISRSLHVLVVDDEPLLREVLADYLTLGGHTVETAANGHQGLIAFQSGRYDLVITDMAMPEMTGAQLAEAIKQQNPDQRVMLVTGFGELLPESDTSLQGVDRVLSKPLTIATLRQAIAEVME
ncbi:MAG: response regulator, partial [Dehalococcoidia bacterium]